MKYIYQSPDELKVRELSCAKPNADGTVDLVDKDGDLDIGKCVIGEGVGKCLPVDGSAKPAKKTQDELDAEKKAADEQAKIEAEFQAQLDAELAEKAKKKDKDK